MLFHLLIFVWTLCAVEGRDDVIRWISSPKLTDFGRWGHEEYCPPGTWVSAVNLKIEDDQGRGDDTALNGIQLTCSDMTGDDNGTIKSTEGPWGFQRGVRSCRYGFMAGFEMKSERYQGSGDDAGAIDLRLLCGDGEEIVAGGILTSWGDWTGKQWCPKQSAVCGIVTQIEDPQGSGDDTALNNVRLACCKIPHPAETCKPTSEWKTVIACRAGITNCNVQFRSGKITVADQTATGTWSKTQYEQNGFDMSGEYGLSTIKARAATLGDNGTTLVNSKPIRTLISETTYFEEEWSFDLNCVGKAQELFIVCGPYEISTKEYQCLRDVSSQIVLKLL